MEFQDNMEGLENWRLSNLVIEVEKAFILSTSSLKCRLASCNQKSRSAPLYPSTSDLEKPKGTGLALTPEALLLASAFSKDQE